VLSKYPRTKSDSGITVFAIIFIVVNQVAIALK